MNMLWVCDVAVDYNVVMICFVGTIPWGDDVVYSTEVGVTNQVVLSDLVLTSGLEYYATVKGISTICIIGSVATFVFTAYDFVGSVAQATSMPVIVDTSPPIIDRLWIGEMFDHSLTSLNNVHLSWDPIVDPESGLVSLEWAIGK